MSRMRERMWQKHECSMSAASGRVLGQPSDHDPTLRDCGVYPYETFVRTMFHPTPGGVIEGVVLPVCRTHGRSHMVDASVG